jgi:dihydrofolate reductase
MANSRKIVVFDRVSADGYFATAEGGLDFVVPDPDVEREGAAGTPRVDTFLFGRKTYQMFESFWPRVLNDEETAPDPHGPGRSTQQKTFAVALTEATKLVYSRTLKEVHWKNARIAGELEPKQIEALKLGPGKGIMIFGSGSIVSALAEHGLIDEYHLIVTPIFLGTGRSLLSALSKRVNLALLESKAYPSGNVMLRYARKD